MCDDMDVRLARFSQGPVLLALFALMLCAGKSSAQQTTFRASDQPAAAAAEAAPPAAVESPPAAPAPATVAAPAAVRTAPAAPTAPAAAGPTVPAPAGATSSAPAASGPGAAVESPPVELRVTKGKGTLPNDQGQQWREYDISPYTSRVTTTARPEQAIVDWILRETGTEVWFSEPLGLLSANRDTLTVYHTPEMQKLVQDLVERFVVTGAESQAFGLYLMSVSSPAWRSRALTLMRPVQVQSPGIEAWLLSKESAVMLINDLRARPDFREQSNPNVVIQNGQSTTLSQLKPRNYARSVKLRENALPGYELEMGQVQEGYSLQISPLMSRDQRTVDAVIKCYIDQVEKMVPVTIDVPAVNMQRQSVQIQVPQMVSWRLHERFRWPTDQVLLLSCGVVATPNNDKPAFSLPSFLSDSGRADALLFVECRGKANQTLAEPQRTATEPAPNTRGRY